MSKPYDDLSPTERFTSRAEHYAKHRPRYPRELVDLLVQEAGLSPKSVIADVGSGTGILSQLFLEAGHTVVGIEPNDAMRLQAERQLSAWSTFHSIAGTAEATTLAAGSMDGVVAAQAFHWFDGPRAAAEFRRITRPTGFVALIWNNRKTHSSPFLAEYDRIVRRFGSEFARSGREDEPYERLRELFGPDLQVHTLPNSHVLDWDGLCGRLLSASYMPIPGNDACEPMIASLRKAFDKFQVDGRIRMEYETRIYHARCAS